MKKSTKLCTSGKKPIGKNGRCVKSKTSKKCKSGKTPTGKNGRCVKTTRGYKQNPPKSRSTAIRRQIREYMVELGDSEFFSKEDINKFVNVAIRNNLTPSEIDEALDQFTKDYGAFAY